MSDEIDEILEPVDKAAVHPDDPDQSEVSQDPDVPVVGDVDVLPVVGV